MGEVGFAECEQLGGFSSNISRNFPFVQQEEVPKGLECLYCALLKVYPTQRNPLQVVAKQKWWLNGLDPLDYVSMYANPGSRDGKIPPHWHYVGMGLSDLHGDGRVHPPVKDPTQPSGFGLELTFRLKRKEDEEQPPTWPASVLQQLAKNMFIGRPLCVGDSITWHLSLDGSSQSRIRHFLLAEDVQLPPLSTPLGYVNFVQVVGVCDEELKASQRWNGMGVLNLMRQNLHTGGELLVTDLNRKASLLELDFKARDAVDRGISLEGTQLSGVCVQFATWSEWDNAEKRPTVSMVAGHGSNAQSSDGNPYSYSGRQVSADPVRYRGLEVKLNFEAALMLPLMLQSRLAHDRHFSFICNATKEHIMFVSPNFRPTFVSPAFPYISQGVYLQVYIGPELHNAMVADLAELDEIDAATKIVLPRTYEWPNFRFKITIPVEQM